MLSVGILEVYVVGGSVPVQAVPEGMEDGIGAFVFDVVVYTVGFEVVASMVGFDAVGVGVGGFWTVGFVFVVGYGSVTFAVGMRMGVVAIGVEVVDLDGRVFGVGVVVGRCELDGVDVGGVRFGGGGNAGP